jgi:hypothetical protein
MVNARSRKAQGALNTAAAAQRAGGGQTAAWSPMNASASNSSYSSGGDLPDLDSLLSGEGLVNDMPTVRKAQAGTFSVTLADGEMLEAVEVLTVLRDVADGGLLVQIGDKIHRNPPAFADAEFKRRFNGAVSELAKSLSNVKASPPPAQPLVTPPPAVPASSSEATATEMPMEMPSAESLGEIGSHTDETPRIEPEMTPRAPQATTTGNTPKVNMPATPVPGDLPKFNTSYTPLEMKPGRRVPKPSQPVPEIDIGGSVEAYLQHRLSYTPEYAERSIHIRNAPKGGVTIEVDGKFFDAVSDVDDEEVREFLRATIEEWQSRQ